MKLHGVKIDQVTQICLSMSYIHKKAERYFYKIPVFQYITLEASKYAEILKSCKV